jgi:CSLREA domain-containing protein
MPSGDGRMLSVLLRWLASRRTPPSRCLRRTGHLTIECLEDRYAPAFFTVNSLADNTTADNALTLREAILYVDGTLGRSLTAGEQAQVNGTLGSNSTIQFSLPAGPQSITLTSGALDLTNSMTINGPGAANLTINGNNSDRVFVVGQIWSVNLSQTHQRADDHEWQPGLRSWSPELRHAVLE